MGPLRLTVFQAEAFKSYPSTKLAVMLLLLLYFIMEVESVEVKALYTVAKVATLTATTYQLD